ncbi:MAG: hypothetical protein ACTSP4_05120 [Candidatus Hodarchaeales archaeon]
MNKRYLRTLVLLTIALTFSFFIATEVAGTYSIIIVHIPYQTNPYTGSGPDPGVSHGDTGNPPISYIKLKRLTTNDYYEIVETYISWQAWGTFLVGTNWGDWVKMKITLTTGTYTTYRTKSVQDANFVFSASGWYSGGFDGLSLYTAGHTPHIILETSFHYITGFWWGHTITATSTIYF